VQRAGYEAIQRVYRKRVVDRSVRHASGLPDAMRAGDLTVPYLDDIVSAAAKSAVTASLPTHQDVFDYLDVSHFPVLLNNYFSVLAPVEVSAGADRPVKRQVRVRQGDQDNPRSLSHPGPRHGVSDAFRGRQRKPGTPSAGLPEAAKDRAALREVQRRRRHPIPRAGPRCARAEVASVRLCRRSTMRCRASSSRRTSNSPADSIGVGPLVVGECHLRLPISSSHDCGPAARSRPGARWLE